MIGVHFLRDILLGEALGGCGALSFAIGLFLDGKRKLVLARDEG